MGIISLDNFMIYFTLTTKQKPLPYEKNHYTSIHSYI